MKCLFHLKAAVLGVIDNLTLMLELLKMNLSKNNGFFWPKINAKQGINNQKKGKKKRKRKRKRKRKALSKMNAT